MNGQIEIEENLKKKLQYCIPLTVFFFQFSSLAKELMSGILSGACAFSQLFFFSDSLRNSNE